MSLFELLIIICLVVLFFGGKRVGAFTNSVGQGIRSFKKGMNEDAPDETPPPRKGDIVVREIKKPDDAA